MSETAEVMSVGDCVGHRPTVEHAGERYELGHPTPAVLAAVEDAIAADVWAESKSLAAIDPRLASEAKERLLARQHRVGGPLWDAVFQTAAGQLLMLWGLIRVGRPEFTREQAAQLMQDAPDACELALVLASPDFIAAVADRVRMNPGRAAAAVGKAKAKVQAVTAQ